MKMLFTVSLLISCSLHWKAQAQIIELEPGKESAWKFNDVTVEFSGDIIDCGETVFRQLNKKNFLLMGAIWSNWNGDMEVTPLFDYDSIVVHDRFVNSWGLFMAETVGSVALDTTVVDKRLNEVFVYSRWNRTPFDNNTTSFKHYDRGPKANYWKPYKPKLDKEFVRRWAESECRHWGCDDSTLQQRIGIKSYARQIRIRIYSKGVFKQFTLKFLHRNGEC